MGSDLAFERLPCQPERASLGVLTDRPYLPRVDHAPAERLDSLQRLGDIAHREVGQREGIAGPAPAGMDADRGGSRVRLPALALSIWRASSSTPRSSAQKRRARSGSSAGNSISDSGEPGTAHTITPLGGTPVASPVGYLAV